MMHSRPILMLAALLLTAAGAFAQSAQSARPMVPTTKNKAAWRRHILPTESELAFEKIPWADSFGAGMKEARVQNKPVLFWAMNGHPLGCT